MVAFSAIAGGLGLLGSVLGNKNKGAEPSKSGFAALPKEVQNAYLDTYLPDVLEQYKQPFQAIPMARVEDTGDPFQSQALLDLQQYSDDIGGLFTPYGDMQNQTTASEPMDTQERDDILSLIDFVQDRPKGNLVGSRSRYIDPVTNQKAMDLDINPLSVSLSELIARLK